MPGGAVGPVSTGNVFKTGLFPRHYLWAFILVTSLFFLWGFAYGLLDVLNKHFQNTLGITTTQSTGLQAAYFGIGYFAFSPVAGEVLRRRGYRFTIIMGLCLYSLGAILFWPVAKSAATSTNKNAVFGGFVVCTAVTACGLASLEISANSYVSVMPPIEIASLRLQFSQAFNGVASFTGPLIASKYFFSDPTSKDLTSVQWVYLAVSGMGMIVAVAFFFTKLPEVSESQLEELIVGGEHKQKSIWKETRCLTGAVAQFLYVGAQVSIGAFFLYYTHDASGISDARGSQLLSYALILFTVGRFVVTGLLSVFTAPAILFVFAIVCSLFTILIGTLHGMGGVACLMMIMFFESCMYPCIFTLATHGLGHNTRRGAALIVMGVSGGAVFPPMQGAIKDAYNARVSFFIVLPCFIYISLWAAYTWVLDGRQIFALKSGRSAADVESGSVASLENEDRDKKSAEVEVQTETVTKL
ncbi:major facilitator superfamily transporter [Cutaneotrichosporon oleaginosum]|uniref:Major facilitator superfamily transporter n=1 Tax=Cutaneotrichosporon oleaginosum TaxID=879819 RepID=A0A0J0XKP0_9TREE|nr:major facilitator superfamily transporter [Cutaneotrichosporon oleaginosum]KLT41671.1 major facilitator superfamily transporter [Cutaneotrichosporon oleaginosum]TXT08043.1 hypothetical protein COLE_04967 [Cutaneotrichosporon oleaginosum]